MSCHYPETIVLASKGIETSAFGKIPYANALVLRIGKNQLLPWVKQYARNVVVMAATSIHFPSLIDKLINYEIDQFLKI
jgi:hypothetical protein